jgi:hypothetical protein
MKRGCKSEQPAKIEARPEKKAFNVGKGRKDEA